jgi:hypothetical protein
MEDCATAYIYFDYQDRLTQSTTNVLLSLLKQLLRCLGPSQWPPRLFQKLSKKVSDVSNTLDSSEVTKYIIHCARQFPKVFFIFDALDECEDLSSRSKLIDFMNTATQLESRIRILFTSRPQLPTTDCSNQGTIVIRSLKTDVETYIRANIKYKRYPTVLQDEIVTKIVASSDGLYFPSENNLIQISFTKTPPFVRPATIYASEYSKGTESVAPGSGSILSRYYHKDTTSRR